MKPPLDAELTPKVRGDCSNHQVQYHWKLTRDHCHHLLPCIFLGGSAISWTHQQLDFLDVKDGKRLSDEVLQASTFLVLTVGDCCTLIG